MDKDAVSARLESMRLCVQRIQGNRPATAQRLSEDIDLQDIICINLERAVQVCGDLAAHLIADAELPAPTAITESLEQLCSLGLTPCSARDSDEERCRGSCRRPVISVSPFRSLFRLFGITIA
jgi:uncharacterized protein YutE (UPF0331/DUF86 family)